MANRYYTINRIKFSEVKSGLQKAIRRGDEKAAISYVIEADGYMGTLQKGNRTNIINRLKIISVEDVCQPEILSIIYPWFESWKKNRESEDSRIYLISIVKALCKAKKLRILSHFKIFYDPEEYRNHIGPDYDHLFTRKSFDISFKEKDPNCLRFLKDEKFPFPQTKHFSSPWLKKFYDSLPNHKERFLFSMASIIYDFLDIRSEEYSPKLERREVVDKLYSEHRPPPYKCGWLPDDIVCDVHTGKSRTAKTLFEFAMKGAHVENMRSDYRIPLLEDLYILNKKNSEKNYENKLNPSKTFDWDNILPEKTFELPEDPYYAQKVTASWKQFTILTKDWVYKGPFEGKREMVPEEVRKISLIFQEHGDCVLVPEIIFVKGKKYMKYVNIAKKWPPEYKMEKIKGDVIGKLVDRSSIGIFNGYELIKNGKMFYNKMYFHFSLRYILGRGDSNLNNYINNVGIDFEEKRLNLDQKGIFLKIFNKLPNQTVRKILEENLEAKFIIKKILSLKNLKKEERERRDLLVRDLENLEF